MSNKGGTYRKPSVVQRRPAMTRERAEYLYQSSIRRMASGRECSECFRVGPHAPNCAKGE